MQKLCKDYEKPMQRIFRNFIQARGFCIAFAQRCLTNFSLTAMRFEVSL